MPMIFGIKIIWWSD